jgi:S1-C subfamily serine protease
LPDERTVVLSVVVLGGGTLFVVVDWVVVVVLGAGFSTTVVHEVRSTAAHARSGVRMISFFIVGIVSFTARFGAGITARCISDEVF